MEPHAHLDLDALGLICLHFRIHSTWCVTRPASQSDGANAVTTVLTTVYKGALILKFSKALIIILQKM